MVEIAGFVLAIVAILMFAFSLAFMCKKISDF